MKTQKPKKSPSMAVVSAASIANTSNLKRGQSFEKTNDFKLTKNGIPCNKRTVTTNLGKAISDHSYEGKTFTLWAESTLSLDTKKARELVAKKNAILEVRPEIDTWVLYYGPNTTKASRRSISNAVSILKKNGWNVFIGDEEIDLHIESLKIREGITGEIPVAKAVEIEIDSILENTKNRQQNKQQIIKIAKSILKIGFTSNLLVVPEWKRGRFTGKYILFDGHHRLAAVKYLIEVIGYPAENFKTLPCILVDWVTSEDKKSLHRLLTATNWTATKWQIRDYISSYRQHAKEIGDKEMYRSYDYLYQLYKISKQSGLKEGTLLYRLGPVVPDTDTLSFDLDCIKRGEYRLNKKQTSKREQFTFECLIPFETWFSDRTLNPRSVNDVSRVFSRLLLQDYLTNVLTIDECIAYTEAFKTLGNTAPINKKGVVEQDFWDNLTDIVYKVA